MVYKASYIRTNIIFEYYKKKIEISSNKGILIN